MYFQSFPGLTELNPATMPSFGLRIAVCGMSVHPGVVQNSENPELTIVAGVIGVACLARVLQSCAVQRSNFPGVYKVIE